MTHKLYERHNGVRGKSPAYQTWRGMKARCYNTNNKYYHKYGGAGITVCDRWRYSFGAFLEDMGERPPGHTLDRKNNKLGYTPENCRWATRKSQRLNQKLHYNTKIGICGNMFYYDVRSQGLRLRESFPTMEEAQEGLSMYYYERELYTILKGWGQL
jgi:hypothetical protein